MSVVYVYMTYVMHLTHEHIDLTCNLAQSHSLWRDPLERYVTSIYDYYIASKVEPNRGGLNF